MNPSYGIFMWIIVGGLGGWLAGKFMGTSKKQSTMANIFLGILGAIVGGFLVRFIGDSADNNGFFASTTVATLGACLVIYVKNLLSGERPNER